MEIIIDYSKINEIIASPPYIIVWEIIKAGGWVVFLWIFLLMVRQIWLSRRQGKFTKTLSNVLLAIDVPKNNEQTPKAIESIFAHLAGAHASQNFKDKWWKGKYQECFSLELISINGYIQFLIRTPTQFRDLVEAAVYSQYPDAEISEVEDYITGIPSEFPDDIWDMWGTEFVLCAPNYLPIRTYPLFEHPLTAEFKDPMSTILEQMSSLKDGEQLWFQIIIKPIAQDWADEGVKFMNKVMGKASADTGKGLGKMLGAESKNIAQEIQKQVLGDITGGGGSEGVDLLKLTPNEKNKIDGAEMKISKIGYECAMRMVYVARKEVMNKPKVISGFIGTLKQFNTNNLNAIKPDLKRTGTSKPIYYLVNYRTKVRQRKMMNNYKKRSHWAGSTPFIFNVEELATLFHFPLMSVKAPLVQKTESRRGEPPTAIPYADSQLVVRAVKSVEKKTEETAEALPETTAEKKAKKQITKKAETETEEIETEPPANLPVG